MLTYGKWAHDAVGIMILLANAARTGAAVSGPELARRLHLGSALVSKQMRLLGRAGLVTARRGLHGGYRLAQPANSITLLDVVEIFSSDRHRGARCKHCRPPLHCPVHESLQAANQVSCARLGALTLQQCAESMRGVAGVPPQSCLDAGLEFG